MRKPVLHALVANTRALITEWPFRDNLMTGRYIARAPISSLGPTFFKNSTRVWCYGPKKASPSK
jgi:hypothetical protein